MNISLSWLNKYIETSLNVGEISDILTSIGLEVAAVEESETIKGGLKGCVVGKVRSCIDHPNSDHLHITQVDLGGGELTQIVCGAPNIAEGQTVVVATIGTTLYSGEDSFMIKKSKLRGEASYGMICSQKELQLGSDASGIMTLDDTIPAGTDASKVFDVDSDYIIEVDITPNRVDATSHLGVARELHAYLATHQPDKIVSYRTPSFNEKFEDSLIASSQNIDVEVEDSTQVIRYAGLLIEGIEVKESPKWLKDALLLIGQKPINNIVDVTNYVLFDIGQPLHAFDLDQLHNNTIHVRRAKKGEKIITLDGVEQKLDEEDVVIADDEDAKCIAGVMGGIDSGVTNRTKRIFLESATFNPTLVRKTARRHALSTDSSFRFERGLDPDNVTNALHQAYCLIKELCPESYIAAPLCDYYPEEQNPYQVSLSLQYLNDLIGQNIGKDKIKIILENLDIKVEKDKGDVLNLAVPRYRIDVTRPVDVVEEILRIYGYNNIALPNSLHCSLSHLTDTDKRVAMQRVISEMLAGAGFMEVLNNSLTSSKVFLDHGICDEASLVALLNPLSQDLNVMRPSMVWGGLLNLDYNMKHKQGPLNLFEFGSVYKKVDTKDSTELKGFREDQVLALWMSGDKPGDHWQNRCVETDLFQLKAQVYNILSRLGVMPYMYQCTTETESASFAISEEIRDRKGSLLVRWGRLSKRLLHSADISVPVFYAEFYWKDLYLLSKEIKVEMYPISKFPAVRRDFALLLDKEIPFVEIEKVAYRTERKLLKSITLFDVYEDPNHLPPGKKSYAVAFELQNEEKTLSDKAIDAVMGKIQKALEKELGASLR